MHALEKIMAEADGFLLIGHSGEGRFPGLSYHAYTTAGRRFYCLDMGGLTESRGSSAGGPVYTRVEDLPPDHDDLAIIWVKPHTATAAVELAAAAGCERVWFSFKTGHRDAITRAAELGLEVVEVGRCPVYYLEGAPMACRLHTNMTRLSGTRRRPPQLEPDPSRRRELL
ncbi:MAG: hypothetical protein ACI8S6_005497 [Myxococcota bacterium]